MIATLARIHVPRSLGWGIGLALVTAVVSGISIFVNGFAVKQLPDAAVYTTLKNGVAAMLLIALAAASVRPATIRTVTPGAWLRLGVIGVIGGSIPFLLFFSGLAQASAPSAAFIHKTLFVWVALLAVPFLGERLGWIQVGALAILLGGQAMVLTPTGVTWGTGETLIAAATVLWAIETILARRVLAGVPSSIVGAARLGIGLVVLTGFLVVTGKLPAVASLTSAQWGWVVLTGLLLSGYVGTWFAALQRAPASVVTAVLVVGAPVTAALQAISTGNVPAPSILAGHGLILAAGGVLLLQVVAWSRSSGRRPAVAEAVG